MAKGRQVAEEAVQGRISEERVGELLDIAAEVFFEHGFAAASVGEMARRAKASKGTYYSRYSTKEDLFTGIIRRRTDQAYDVFCILLADDKLPLEEMLRRFSSDLLTLVLSPEAISLVRLLYMEARHFPGLGRVFYEYGYGRIHTAFVDFLRDQVRKGHLRIDNNIPIAAEQFLDGLIGPLSRKLALGVESVSTRREQDTRIAVAVKAFLAAYCPEVVARPR